MRSTEEIEEEAAGWVARLNSADAGEADRVAFAAWQESDPRHAEAFAEFDALWGDLRGVQAAEPARLRRTGLAVIVAAGLGLAAFGGPEAWLRLSADAIAGTGEIRHLTLPDGSRLDLDTGAAVALDFDAEQRRVIVLRGAVFAEARPDRARPFILETSDLTARALGTRFGVEGDALVVTEGRVEARGGGEAAVFVAGETGELRDGGFSRTLVNPDQLAWREGLLVVSGLPLGEVLASIGRYQRGRLLLLDRAAAARPVSGVFDLSDPAEALRVLSDGLGLRLTRLPGLTVLR